MAPGALEQKKRKTKALTKQVKSVIRQRRLSSSSSENELSVVQLRKKLKALKQINPKEEQLASLKIEQHIENRSGIEQHAEIRREQIEITSNHIVQYAPEIPQNGVQEYEQMYGKDYDGEAMVVLMNNIYCRKRILNMALCSSHRASHLARKLLEGVFKPETLINCTLTGMPARAQGKERQNRNVIALDFNGRTAIIDFSIDVAEKRGWSAQSSEFIRRQMSQRIGELKRNVGDKSQ